MAKKKAAAKKVADKSATSELSFIHPQLREMAVPIDQLEPDPRNHNKHNSTSVSRIAGSLRAFGQRKPVSSQRQPDGRLVVRAGNGTLMAARLLGWSHVATIIDDEADAHAIAWSIADNQTPKYAEIDRDVLSELLEEAEFEDPELLAMAADIEDLLAGADDLLPPSDTDHGDDDASDDDEDDPDAFGIAITVGTQREQTALLRRLKDEGLNVKKFNP